MSGFSASWLALREPHDARARNAEVFAAVTAHVAAMPAITIVDLACGTGATMRALAPKLAARQTWRLVDNDLSLLARVPPSPGATCLVRPTPIDLVHDLEGALDGLVDLVTTSAFLDLVSEDWLDRLVTEIAVRGLPIYAALSYDGRLAHVPPDAADDAVGAAFNRHQRSDKGFGPALGPAAATNAITRFERLGYAVVQGASDWLLAPGDPVSAPLHAGIAAAAREAGGDRDQIDGWIGRTVSRDTRPARPSLRVGHLDFFAAPSTRR